MCVCVWLIVGELNVARIFRCECARCILFDEGEERLARNYHCTMRNDDGRVSVDTRVFSIAS